MFFTEDKTKELIIKSKLLSEKKLIEVAKFAKDTNVPLIQALINKSLVTDTELGALFAKYLGVPFVVLSKETITPDLARIISGKVAIRQKAFAFARDKKEIKVAFANPKDSEFISLVERKTGLKVKAYYSSDKEIETTIKLYKRPLQNSIDLLLRENIYKPDTAIVLDEAPIAKIVEELIQEAYSEKASDIHIEPEEQESLVRFRIDGQLHDMVRLPRLLHDRFISRIKVLSNLRTDEHLSAQDGKMHLLLEEEDLDIRVSIIPVSSGEKVVLRLLSSKSREFTLSNLGMNDTDLNRVTAAFGKSYGMILSTGPTGSGKTTTIYSILKILNTRGKNITTIEDPIEYRIRGANQVQVNAKTNLTFASGLRSILRQDPNVIFVGEIRDGETAGIAVNAALTGHLVLSTLHTSDAATSIPRLMDMKVEPFLVASTVNVIIAQRLVRKICESCRGKVSYSRVELSKHVSPRLINKYFGNKKNIKVYEGKGCKLCNFTGFSGRLGIFEVLEVSKNIRKLVAEKVDAEIIEEAAKKEGMKTMMEDGLEKVYKGITTIGEVLSATKIQTM
ncbi:type II/IV secretion system protein [Candidatus Woesebacteria bacterium]|nr:type II/IV secretion system protein [Candidatus Woesebacteria bacterium]